MLAKKSVTSTKSDDFYIIIRLLFNTSIRLGNETLLPKTYLHLPKVVEGIKIPYNIPNIPI